MRIGTRGSALALAQSAYVRELLPRGDHPTEVIETTGDRNPDLSFRRIGGKGVFTKEIELALLDGRIDLAVHSLKDLPTEETPGLVIAALLAREDPRDVLIARTGKGLADLPPGATVGTSSLRRRSQLLARRPDLVIQELRGNVPTRIARMKEGRYDAIVVAAAGLRRLGLTGEIVEILDDAVMLPAPGQGILAIQTRENDSATNQAVASLNDAAAEAEAAAERGFLAGLGGGCLVPVGAHGIARGGRITLAGFVGHPDGRPALRSSGEGNAAEAAALGQALALALLEQGAREILDEVRGKEVSP